MESKTGLSALVATKFKGVLPNSKYLKFIEMAGTIDENGEEALSWDEDKAFKKQFAYTGAPTKEDWKEFLRNSFINSYLNQEALVAKRPVLRKIIGDLNSIDKISPQQIKMLEVFQNLIDKAEKEDNQTIYVQYMSSNRFGETKVVDELIQQRVFDTSDMEEIAQLPDKFTKDKR